MHVQPFATLNDLLAADARGEISDTTFDDELWFFMTSKNGPYEQPLRGNVFVRNYVASRLLQWEVGNGGFAQAAYNAPEWFEPAALGYEALGLPLAAERIRTAISLIAHGAANFTRGPGVTIEQVFSAFTESALSALDEGLDSIGWWATERRVVYVRTNRESFVGAV
jgi:hypothetical protein